MSDFLGYQEIIDRFIFREKAAITIPKRVRESSYLIKADIEIISIAKEAYKNFASIPPFGFYGYAVIVLQDYSKIQIPLNQSRQRLYEFRINEAFTNWYSLYLFEKTKSIFDFLINTRISRIETELGIVVDAATFQCPSPPVFIEAPIREVYVRSQFGTTFALEVSYWKPNAVDYDGCAYDGKSGQSDGSKDSGLPANGSQPVVSRNPSNPYADAATPSSLAQIGDYANSKLDNASLTNIDNISLDAPATEGSDGFYWEVSWVSGKSPQVCEARRIVFVVATPKNANFRVDPPTPLGSSPCVGHKAWQWRLVNPNESLIFGRGAAAPDAPIGVRKFGKLPVPDRSFLPE